MTTEWEDTTTEWESLRREVESVSDRMTPADLARAEELMRGAATCEAAIELLRLRIHVLDDEYTGVPS